MQVNHDHIKAQSYILGIIQYILNATQPMIYCNHVGLMIHGMFIL